MVVNLDPFFTLGGHLSIFLIMCSFDYLFPKDLRLLIILVNLAYISLTNSLGSILVTNHFLDHRSLVLEFPGIISLKLNYLAHWIIGVLVFLWTSHL